MHPTVQGIYRKAYELVELPKNPRYTAGGGVSDSGLWVPSKFPPKHTDVKEPTESKPSPPDNYAPPEPPSVSVSPVGVSFSGFVGSLNWPGLPEAHAPRYFDPTQAPDWSDVDIPTPPLRAPVVSLAAPDAHVRSRASVKPQITPGARLKLSVPTADAYAAIEVMPFDKPMPEPPWLLDAGYGVLLEPERLDYNGDADLIRRLKVTLTGSDTLGDAVQAALHARKTHAIARDELMKTQAAMSLSAARGFSLPTGAVNAAVAEVAHDARSKRIDAAIEVRDDVYESARSLLVDAMSRCIAHEAKRFEMHLAYCKQLVDVLRFNARMAVALLNAVIENYNARLGLAKALLADYRDYLGAVEAQDSAVVADVQRLMLEAETWSLDARMYEAQVGTIEAQADVESTHVRDQVLALRAYEAQLSGVMVQIDAQKATLDGFSDSVRAFTQGVKNEVERLDSFADFARADASAAGVWSANIENYVKFWRTEGQRQGAWSDYVQASGRAVDDAAREFGDYAQAHRSVIQAEMTRINAEADMIRARISANEKSARFSSAYNRAAAQYAASDNSKRLAEASQAMNEQAMKVSGETFKAGQKANELATNATISAGLAQAALGVISATANIRGDTGTSHDASSSSGLSVGLSGGRSWSVNRSS